MGLTGFNRTRQQAAERLGKDFDEVPYDMAVEVLEESEVSGEPSSDAPDSASREERTTELKALNWEDLKDLLTLYNLPVNKPKGKSWDEFAIPQILQFEGF